MDFLAHLTNHWGDFLDGALFLGFVAHMVNTMPPSNSVWGNWIVGGIKWLVGQRISGANMMNGLQTASVSVPKSVGTAPNITQQLQAQVDKVEQHMVDQQKRDSQ